MGFKTFSVIFIFTILGASNPLLAQSKNENLRKEHPISQPLRLHEWLQGDQGKNRLDYDLALSWIAPDQRALDQKKRSKVRDFLVNRSLAASTDPLGATQLLRLLDLLPYDGRVYLPSTDSRWLEVNSQSDPNLNSGDLIISFKRPQDLVVVHQDGNICRLKFVPGQPADSYAESCGGKSAGIGIFSGSDFSRPTIWVAQPDGYVAKSLKNPRAGELRVVPAPGAWIWVPRNAPFSNEDFSRSFAEILAAQGPAGEYLRPLLADEFTKRRSILEPLALTRSNWGNIGLLQMPTARMAPESSLAVSRTIVDPYRRLNVFIQPLPWFEMGLRYTEIRNKANADVPYTDKSIDAKITLFNEGDYLPQISLGVIDAGGTGLFASEYMVASKRFGAIDLSAGLAFGYLGSGGKLKNPLGMISNRYEKRIQSETGLGGKPGISSWFTGPMSPFIGAQWAVEGLPKWIFKAEYSSNDNSAEPYLANDFYTIKNPSSRFNVGAVYRVSDWVDFSVGIERGNQIGLGLTLYTELNRKPTPKILDAPLASPTPQAIPGGNFETSGPGWDLLRREIESKTLWSIEKIESSGSTLYVRFFDASSLYASDRIELIGRTLNQLTPQWIDRFVIEIYQSGLAATVIEIDRKRFALERNSLVSHAAKEAHPAITEKPFADDQGERSLLVNTIKTAEGGPFSGKSLSGGLGISYDQLLGGPTGFFLYELGVKAQAVWRPRVDFWVQGRANYRVIDNYDRYPDQTASLLPPVRTLFKSYKTGSRFTLPNIQATHVGQPFGERSNHYYSVYGGMLEYMYGGYGAEYLYRPWKSQLAFGADINQVRQRDFDQRFSFRDLKSTTGHITGYWDTGWNDVLVVAKAGRYMAGDKGFTLQLSRTFKSGVVFGGFFTRTNVSAEQFGEGSFDKVLYVQIPFDLVLPTRSNSMATFGWRNLTRDGGVILGRENALYDLTSKRDRRSMIFGTQ